MPKILGCERGHRFDVARQGYVALLAGGVAGLASDTAEMVSARTRVLDPRGPFDRLRASVAELVGDDQVRGSAGVLLDVGSGTGQYTAGCLDRLTGADGIGLDLSKVCARTTARAHPRLAGIVADAWSRLPLADASVAVVLSVFAPRNFDEFVRVLTVGGRLVVAAPEPAHLHELIEPMRMLRVGDDKYDALLAATAGSFTPLASEVITYRVEVSAEQIADLVGMGPSAFHASVDEIYARATDFAGDSTTSVTVSVRASVLERR